MEDSLFPAQAMQEQQPEQNTRRPGIADRWRGWMSNPENAALLMQTGISMLQPMQPGQGTLGAIASSVGSGFAARDRVIQGDRDRTAEQEDRQLKRDEAQSVKEHRRTSGLADMLRAQKEPKGFKPRDLDAEYSEFYQKISADTLKPFGEPGSPEFEAQVKDAFLKSLQSPAAKVSVPGVPTNVEETKIYINPKTGQRIRLDPETNAWVPI